MKAMMKPAAAFRGYDTGEDYVPPEPKYTKDGAIIVDNVAFTLEWILSSPPPLHAFEEPPTMVEWPEGEDHGHH